MNRALPLIAAGGLAAAALGAVSDPARGWPALLASVLFFLTLALGALVFLAVHQVAHAGWFVVIKRVPEAMAMALPACGALLLLTMLGLPALYPWAGGHAKDLHGKEVWLDAPFFLGRMVLILAVWVAFAVALRRASTEQDRDGEVAHTRRGVALSAGFLVALAPTFSVASFDWLMSLDPHWFSTIFAFYNLGGVLSGAAAGITLLVVWLRRAGRLRQVHDGHLHDLGKLMFAFSTLWAYLWLSQYLLIWYSNLPEETGHYLSRTQGGWSFLFWMNLVLGWALPFVSLLPRRAKRSEGALLRAAGALLLGRWLDLYLLVAPAVQPEHAGIGLVELGAVLGVGAIFFGAFGRAASGAPLEAKRDPYFEESLHEHA